MVCYVNFLSATSPDTMDGSPARSIMLIHQLHVAGEEGGSATMVAVFLPVLPVGVVLCLSSRDVTRSSYVAVGTKKLQEGPARGLGMLPSVPPWPAPHQVTIAIFFVTQVQRVFWARASRALTPVENWYIPTQP
jgi:hypothetical protein